MKRLSLIIVGFGFITQLSAAPFAVLGALNLTGTAGDRIAAPGVVIGGKASLGFGVTYSATDNPIINIEFGAFYIPRKISTGIVNEMSLNSIETPLLLRFTLLPLISVGAGVYYAYALNSPSATDAFQYSRHDLGFVFTARLDLPVLPGFGVVGDLRYLNGLRDLDNDAFNTFYFRDIQLLAGVRFDL